MSPRSSARALRRVLGMGGGRHPGTPDQRQDPQGAPTSRLPASYWWLLAVGSSVGLTPVVERPPAEER